MQNNLSSKKLTNTAAIIMSATLLSRITGFLRNLLIYTKMRPGGYSDEFLLAFTLPDLIYNLLAGGAIAAALIPVLSTYLTKGKEDTGWKAISTFMNMTVIVMLVFEVIFFIWTDGLLGLIAGGINESSGGDKALLISLTRILLLSAPFMMMAGECNGILNSYKQFAAASFGPVFYNLFTIISIALFGSVNPNLTAWGVVISAAFFFLLQLSSTFKHFKHYRPRLYIRSEAFRRLLKLAIPSLLSSSILELNLIVSRGSATFFSEGMLTLLNNANRTWQMPLGIFAQSVGIALLPTLSEHHAAQDMDVFKKTLYKGIRVVFLFALPTSLFLMIQNQDIMRVLFKWGSLKESDVFIGGLCLLGYSSALIFASMLALLTRAFYAIHDSKTPLISGLLSIAVNYLFNFIFRTFTPIGIAGTALAYSIAAFVNMLILVVAFHRKTQINILWDNFGYIVKSILAVIPASLTVLLLSTLLKADITSKLSQIITVIIPFGMGGVVFWFAASKFRIPEIQYVSQMVVSRFKRRATT